MTPLSEACQHAANSSLNTFESIEILIGAGANVNASDVFGNTILHRVCNHWFGDNDTRTDIVIALLQAGANVHAVNKRNNIKIYDQLNLCNIRILQAFLDNGVNFNEINQNQNGSPLFHQFLQRADAIEILNLLVQLNHIDLDRTDKSGNTALHLACSFGKVALISYLLSQEVKLDIKNDTGQTALDILKNQHPELIPWLEEAGVNIL